MPVISRFYGIVIKMFFREHGVAHFHALYAEHNIVVDIGSLTVIEGDFPARAEKLVLEWAKKYQSELGDMWKTQKFVQLPGLE